jgi:hypothetical protein
MVDNLDTGTPFGDFTCDPTPGRGVRAANRARKCALAPLLHVIGGDHVKTGRMPVTASAAPRRASCPVQGLGRVITRSWHGLRRAALATGGDARGGVVVAASLGSFTAPMVAEALDARAVLLVNPMVPLPGETPGEWWGATGAVAARRLHVEPVVVPGGHLAALSQPGAIASAILAAT